MICCPGLDFCSLANAGSIDVAKLINERFDDFDYVYDLGEIDIKMSGCMNACGHHHVGNIGILGVDKSGEEWYQITHWRRRGREGGARARHRALRTEARGCGEHRAPVGGVRRRAARGRALPRHRAPPRRQAVQGEGVCRDGCCVTAASSRTIGARRATAPCATTRPLIVTFADGRPNADAGCPVRGRLGVVLEPADEVERLVPDLARFASGRRRTSRAPAKAAATPRDGCCASDSASARSCAPAAAIRRDQVFFLARCGFNSFELPESELEGAAAALSTFSAAYQPSTTSASQTPLAHP